MVEASRFAILFIVCGNNEEIERNSKIIEPCTDVVSSFSHFSALTRINPTFETIKATILEFHPVIIHFIGHGNESGILFGGEFASNEEIMTFFKHIHTKPELILFSTCDSFNLVESLAEEALIPCIGSKRDVLNLENKGFLKPFYVEILKGGRFSNAVLVANSFISDLKKGESTFVLQGQDTAISNRNVHSITEKRLTVEFHPLTAIGGPKMIGTCFSVKGINTSPRPIRVESYGFFLPETNLFFIINPSGPIINQVCSTLPAILKDGDICQGFMMHVDVKRLMVEKKVKLPIRVKGFVRTAEGSFFSDEVIVKNLDDTRNPRYF